MAKKSNSNQATWSIFQQDMMAGPSETNLQSSIGSYLKKIRSRLLAQQGRASFSGICRMSFFIAHAFSSECKKRTGRDGHAFSHNHPDTAKSTANSQSINVAKLV